ncbi:MAG: asparagine synthase-related protein [Acidobacteriaceae bacterium]
MLRYVALVRLEESEEARAVYSCAFDAAKSLQRGLSLGYETAAARILYADTAPGRIRMHPLGQNGIVMGTLFRRAGGTSGPINSLSAGDVEEITASQGNSLIHQHWGHYIAVIRSSNGLWRVLRDPTGGLPCYYILYRGVAVIFSHLNDCTGALPVKLSVNYSHLQAFLHLHRFVARDTGFNEIQPVHAGEAIDFRKHVTARSFLWEPAEYCSDPTDHENIEESIISMRKVVRRCVHSWAATRRSILHELSGGLDSSIVLACLATAPSTPRLSCCTHVTDSPEGDERHYARLMASHFGVPLAELPLRPQSRNRVEDLIHVRDPISPLLTSFQCSEESEIRDLIASDSFDCTFSGQGGDHLFLRTLPSITAADCAWVHGLSFQSLKAISDTAHASGQTICSIARQAIRYGYLRRPYDIWHGSRVSSFIRVPPLDPMYSYHPWLSQAAEIPPAKLLQIMCLTETQTYLATPRPYVDDIHPLISQPLLELCLQIPAYILSHGGTDRTIARAAFRDALPAEVANRSSKGAISQFLFKAVYGNGQHIRRLLMDGLLAERGLLDKRELKRAFDDPAAVSHGRFLIPIMTATIGEIWLRTAAALARSTGVSAAA